MTDVPPEEKMTIYFNPFAFTIEQNNEFLRRGYEPMPMQIPNQLFEQGPAT